MNVAKTILDQLGGNKFVVMTGSKKFVDFGNSISMKLSRNVSGAQYLKIELTPADVYIMTFAKIKKVLNKEYAALGVKIYDDEIQTVKEIENVYCDELQSVFTSVTGLYTRL